MGFGVWGLGFRVCTASGARTDSKGTLLGGVGLRV